MKPMSFSGEDEGSHTDETDRESSVNTVEEPPENLLAKALKSITFDEQQSAIHDIHGVSVINQEDPKMVQQKLIEMEEEISKIKSKDAYLKAKASSPEFVQNKEFRLLFLRTDTSFNAKQAAAKFVKHFELKLELFGEEKLGREIMLQDLEPDDWKHTQTRWLLHRDRSGRAILFWTPPTREQPIPSKLRLMFWSLFLVLRDEETRKNGMVLIFYNVGSKTSPDRKFCFALNDFKKGVPTPFVSFHICYDNPRVRPILSLLLSTLGTFLTVRCRSHYGNAKEVIYSLLTFGIPREALPIGEDGKVIPLPEERLANRIVQEKQPTPNELVVIIPGRFDVLLGRSKRCQDHMGNLRYRNLILSYQDEYEVASKPEKTAIAEKVIKEVHDHGGHFLDVYHEDFIEVSDLVARKKVAHAFRSQRRIQSRRKDRTPGGSPVPPEIFSGFASDGSTAIMSNQVAGVKRSIEETTLPSAKRGNEAAV